MTDPSSVYVGIDFSCHRLDLAIHDASGRALERSRSFPNTAPGHQQLKQWLLERLGPGEGRQLVLGGEATSYYWLPLFAQFAQEPVWEGYAVVTYLLNARWVHWFKKSHSPKHKSDPIDAEDISEYARLQPPATAWKLDAHWLALRLLTRLRFHLSHSLVREKNLAQMYLFLLYPSYTQQRPFANPFGVTSQQVLTPEEGLEGLAEFAQLSVEELEQAVRALGAAYLPRPTQTATRLQQVFRDSFPWDNELREPIYFALTHLLDTIRHLHAQIQQLDQQIAHHLATADYAEVGYLQSIPGIGQVLASGIAAEIGDLARFADPPVWDPRHRRERKRSSRELQDAVHKYAGIWWPKNQSGQFQAENLHLSRAGNPYLRYLVLLAAESMRLRIPGFAAYYREKAQQAFNHKHKRALVLTGSKALDLFVTLLRRREVYKAKEDPSASA